MGFVFRFSRLGAGSIALKPLNAPPPTRGLFAAGSPSSRSVDAGSVSVKLTRIFFGFALSTAKFVWASLDVGLTTGFGDDSVSEPSESEYPTRTMVNLSTSSPGPNGVLAVMDFDKNTANRPL